MPDGGREAVNEQRWTIWPCPQVVPVSEVDRLTQELDETREVWQGRAEVWRQALETIGRQIELARAGKPTAGQADIAKAKTLAAEQRAERAERALREAKRDFEFTLADIRRRLAGDESIDAPFDEDLAEAAVRCERQIAALAALPPTVQQPREEGEW